MARELPDKNISRRTHRQIDWSQYDTGRAWELVQGEDFTQSPRSAAHAARQWGYYNQRRLTIRTFPDRIILLIRPAESASPGDRGPSPRTGGEQHDQADDLEGRRG